MVQAAEVSHAVPAAPSSSPSAVKSQPPSARAAAGQALSTALFSLHPFNPHTILPYGYLIIWFFWFVFFVFVFWVFLAAQHGLQDLSSPARD